MEENLEVKIKSIREEKETCDKAIKIIDDNKGTFTYCREPYKNDKEEVTCGGLCIGSGSTGTIYTCPHLDKVHFNNKYNILN